MRHFLLVAILFIVLSASLGAQGSEFALVTRTPEPQLGPNSAIVLTGQSFTMTYRLEYLDLSSIGEEVIVNEKGLSSGELNVYPFEIRGLTIRKDLVGNRWIWDLEYELFIIRPKKDTTVYIPPISVYWVRKKTGVDVAMASQLESQWDSVAVFYISSVGPSRYKDIRDAKDLGDHEQIALFFSRLSRWPVWALSVIFVLSFLRTLRLRFGRARIVTDKEAAADVSVPTRRSFEEVPFRKARKRLARQIAGYRKELSQIATDRACVLEMQDAIHKRMWEMISDALSLTRGSDVPDFRAAIEAMPVTRHREVLMSLQARLESYRKSVEARQINAAFEGENAIRQELAAFLFLIKKTRWEQLLLFRVHATLLKYKERVRGFLQEVRRRGKKY